MDFGVGFLSNNVMLPILDFFYGIVPSYGLAIIFLTLVIRLALYPLNVGQIRNMRKMKVVNPVMQRRMKEIQARYRDDPRKMQEAQAEIYKELDVNPLGGCLPLLLQMPILIALFTTLRGSPFAPVTFDFNLQILSSDVAAEVVHTPAISDSKNVFLTETYHEPLEILSPKGKVVGVGEKVQFQLQDLEGTPFSTLLEQTGANAQKLIASWTVTNGAERVQFDPTNGSLVALQPGDVTVQASIPGLAAEKGFLFIKKLGAVGVLNDDNSVNWDILAMIIVFGASVYLNTTLTSQGQDTDANSSQNSINKITPLLISGMFLFFPLPAGVLLYILVSNIFQTAQTYLLSKEPLPENLQGLVEDERRSQTIEVATDAEAEDKDDADTKAKAKDRSKQQSIERESLPFEP